MNPLVDVMCPLDDALFCDLYNLAFKWVEKLNCDAFSIQ